MMKIRPARETDWPRAERAAVFSPEEIEVARELLKLATAGSRDYAFLVAEEDDKALSGLTCWGAVPITQGTFDLYWIAVDPARRRGGLGALLLGWVEENVKKRGGRLLVAETSSRTVYRPARSFYSRRGFAQAAVIPDYYALGDDLVIFTKRLD